jgi:P-type Ca2+ transporter type 2C
LKAPHAISVEETIAHFKSDMNSGLNDEKISQRRKTYGRNVIAEGNKISWMQLLLRQFLSPIVYILLFAAALSFAFQEWLDGIAIAIVILINAIIGFYMEFQADRSMNALKKMAAVPAKVKRNGLIIEIDSEDIVTGDILFIEAGDMIAADARMYSSSQLQVDESSLTGESAPVEKSDNLLSDATVLAERTNCIYKGTFVTRGNSYAVVFATGMQTELGKIAGLVHQSDQAATPLEKKLNAFTKKLIWVTLAIVAVIFILGIIRGHDLIEMIETCIALAVAAIPEGMPIVATLALAQGMLKMARYHVIVKKLSAVETLGSTNVICTDKTGTLTQNKMQVTVVVTPSDKWSVEQQQVTTEAFENIMQNAILCNTATITADNETGDPLEVALLKFAQSFGLDIGHQRNVLPKVAEFPFTSETKLMATAHDSGGEIRVFAKGAAESILQKCTGLDTREGINSLTDKDRQFWTDKADELARSGLRVIAMAYKISDVVPNDLTDKLVFSGLIGMVDPPRPEVFSAIKECREAGIVVMMITGDHPSTARKIATELDIIHPGEDSLMTGGEMQEYALLSNSEKDRWMNTRVFARVSPKNKLDLVTLLQERNQVVGMTGDGVNDAPAIKKADIGIAMGLKGTQVAQEVSDMILKDDSFSSIVVAIKQGRIIFDNIKKFVVYLLSCNMSELLLIAIVGIFDLHFQLLALQILFINLITDVFPALALGVTKGSENIMKREPRSSLDPLVDNRTWKAIIFYSAVIAACCLLAVYVSHQTVHNTEVWNKVLCNNILFYTLILSQLFHAFNMDSGATSLWYSEVIRNKYLWGSVALCFSIIVLINIIPPIRNALSLYHVSFFDMAIILGGAIMSFLIIRLAKSLKLIQA